MEAQKVSKCIYILNAIDIIGVSLILLLAFIMQFLLNELPCPLCLLQRIGLLGVAFGFLLNIRFGSHPAHYTLSLLSAMLTAFMAMRQILLHILPGEGGYGDAILGLHLYTWMFVICILAVIYISIILSVVPQYLVAPLETKSIHILTHLAFGLLLFIALANFISTFMECGLAACPDNPVHYVYHLFASR
jgi:disulfide bond formation protein DsbB